MIVRILEADLKMLEERLLYPCAYLNGPGVGRTLRIFVLVTKKTSRTDTAATLICEYHPKLEQEQDPNNISLVEF